MADLEQRWAYPQGSRNGREMIYQTGVQRDQLMAVSYSAKGDSLVTEKPRVWIEKLGGFDCDLSPDGKHMALLTPVKLPEALNTEHEVVLFENFFDELRRCVPATNDCQFLPIARYLQQQSDCENTWRDRDKECMVGHPSVNRINGRGTCHVRTAVAQLERSEAMRVIQEAVKAERKACGLCQRMNVVERRTPWLVTRRPGLGLHSVSGRI
jgi:hypothetical protein